MSDVFISYARSTERQAKAIAEQLRSLGYSVSALHVNHKLRGADSDEDARFCADVLGAEVVERDGTGLSEAALREQRRSVGRDRLRAKLSYTNIAYALAPAVVTISELRELYVAALGHEVSATNLRRVLLRRGVLEPTGARRPPGRTGGRPAEVYRFRTRSLAITDQFAVLRPPA